MKNKVLTVVLSVVIAFALWAYVITVEQPESEATFRNITVDLINEDVLEKRGLMIVSDTELTVDLKLLGNRSDLNKLSNSDITVQVDLARISEAGEKSLPYTVSFPGDVQNGAIEVVNRDPSYIELTVSDREAKEIPVIVEYEGSEPTDYLVDKKGVGLSAETISISGPKDVVDQIHQAKIVIDLNAVMEKLGDKDVSVTDDYRVSLCDEQGRPIEDVSTVTVSNDEITATVGIEMVKDVALTYQVINGGGLTAADVVFAQNYSEITVTGSKDALSGLTEIQLGAIDLNTIEESKILKFPVTLPVGVTNLSNVDEVEVTVTLPPMEVRTYIVTTFRQENVPAGKTVRILERQLEVKVRSMGPILDNLTAEDIVIVVDFTNAINGRLKYDAQIQINGLENVEATGVYAVWAEVSDTAPATA